MKGSAEIAERRFQSAVASMESFLAVPGIQIAITQNLHETVFGSWRLKQMHCQRNESNGPMKLTSEKFDVYSKMKAKAKLLMRTGRRLDFPNSRSAVGSTVFRRAAELRRGEISIEEARNFMDTLDSSIPVPLSIT